MHLEVAETREYLGKKYAWACHPEILDHSLPTSMSIHWRDCAKPRGIGKRLGVKQPIMVVETTGKRLCVRNIQRIARTP
jgi:hypothetical protein